MSRSGEFDARRLDQEWERKLGNEPSKPGVRIPYCPHGHGMLQRLRGPEGYRVDPTPASTLRDAPIVGRRSLDTVWACSTCEYCE